MYRKTLFLSLLLLLPTASCRRAPFSSKGLDTVAANHENERRVQAFLGAGDPDDWGRLPFEITKVYFDQKPTDAAPWHAAGGGWTFFDCRISQPQEVSFTVGVHSKSEAASMWGEATLCCADRPMGTKFLEAFAAAFKQNPPKPRMAQPLQLFKFNTAVLGDNETRSPKGGFSGKGGGWRTTKWFPERDGYSAEVFFNYNLEDKLGEFSEKDPGYREDLLTVLAMAVRDGPWPDRTPQSDSNLTDVGPRLGKERSLSKKSRRFMFSPDGRFVLYTSKLANGPTVLYAVRPEDRDEPLEIARVEKVMDGFACADANLSHVFVRELLPQSQAYISSDDPVQLWWVDREKKETRQLRGPWDVRNSRFGDAPVSPDGRYIAIGELKTRAESKGNYAILHLFDTQTDQVKSIDIPPEDVTQIGWTGSGKDLRVVFEQGRRWDKKSKIEFFTADPASGKYQPVDITSLRIDQPGRRFSPDGKLLAETQDKDKLVITDLATNESRTFRFNEDDLRFVGDYCFEWSGSGYLLLHLNKIAFLDVKTLKMSYPLPKGQGSHSHRFSPDFKWALWLSTEGELFLAQVVLPNGP